MKKKSKKISKKKTSSVSYDDDALTDDTVNDDDAPPNTRRASPDYAEFARAWTNSSTVTEVADSSASSATAPPRSQAGSARTGRPEEVREEERPADRRQEAQQDRRGQGRLTNAAALDAPDVG